MDQVFDTQFHAMHAAFARDGISIDIAYAPGGRVDYLYQTGRLLFDTRRVTLDEIKEVLPGVTPAQDQPKLPNLQVASLDNLSGGYLTVPQAMVALDAGLKDVIKPVPGVTAPAVSPVHVMYLCNGSPDTTRLCPATEPVVPSWAGPRPCPPYPPPGAASSGAKVLIGICDTGLLASYPQVPWLATNVTGQLDPLGPVLPPNPPGLLQVIPQYTGHGTFGAGVARCMAPAAEVWVSNDILNGGGVLETTIVERLMAMLRLEPRPQVINLSAGGYTRCDLEPLSFTAFENDIVTLTAAAGNDSTSRPFYPAAFSWAIGVGALGADRQHLAWFSNYGPSAKIYTLGEGLVNAYATGVYTYQEPPRAPAQQTFSGMALWSGTSFAAPLVAGLIAAQMSHAGQDATAATSAVLARATANAIPGVGPALLP